MSALHTSVYQSKIEHMDRLFYGMGRVPKRSKLQRNGDHALEVFKFFVLSL